MNKQKNYLTQQIHSFHLKNPLMQIVKHYWYVFPFHLVQYANTEFMSELTDRANVCYCENQV